MKIGKYLLSFSLALVLSGCAILGNGFAKNSSSSSYTGASGNGWPWGSSSKTSSGSDIPSSQSVPSSSEPNIPYIYSVQIDAPKTALGIGESVSFTAIVQTEDGPYEASYAVKWATSNSDVASVNNYGYVTGKSIGTATIRAESPYDSNIYDIVSVTVNQHEMVVVAVESFDLDTTYKFGSYYNDGYSYEYEYYYANGEITNQSGPCLATARSWNSAVDLKIEGTVGHYHLALFVDGQKKYINSVSDVDYHVSLGDYATNDWSWDEKYYTFTTVVNGVKYLIQRSDNYSNNYYYMQNYDDASYTFISRLLIQTERMDPESIDIIEENVRALAGSEFYLHARISPIGASLTRLNWAVLDNEYVRVYPHGFINVNYYAKRGSTATIKASWESGLSDTCVLSIYNYGTLDDPLTVDEACELIDEENPIQRDVFISGVVTSNTAYGGSNWESIVLANNNGSISSKLYVSYADSYADYGSIYNQANSLVGKRVIVSGYCQLESSRYTVYYSSLRSVSN